MTTGIADEGSRRRPDTRKRGRSRGEAATPDSRGATHYRLVVQDCDGTSTRFDYGRLLGLPFVSRVCEFRCGSGSRWGGHWRGVHISRLLEAAGISGGATHLIVRSGEYVVCVPLRVAFDGVLALERDGQRLPLGNRAPRLVAPGLDSIRTVKGVEAIRGLRLSPGADRTDHEALPVREGSESN